MAFLRRHLSERQRRLVKFCIVGASGVPVNLGFVYLTTRLLPATMVPGTRDSIAFLVGIVVSIFTNFLLNNVWTWGDRSALDPGGFWRRLGKFYVVSSVAAAVQYGTTVGVSAWMREHDSFSLVISDGYHLYHVLAPVAGIAIGLVINFLANHLWTFRKKAVQPTEDVDE